ncbi:MAG: nucleotidyltransferase family protein [Acidimicrobiales bacterium]
MPRGQGEAALAVDATLGAGNQGRPRAGDWMSDTARWWASLADLPAPVDAVVVGSLARGDVDVLLVGDDLPGRWSSSGGPQPRGAG